MARLWPLLSERETTLRLYSILVVKHQYLILKTKPINRGWDELSRSLAPETRQMRMRRKGGFIVNSSQEHVGSRSVRVAVLQPTLPVNIDEHYQ